MSTKQFKKFVEDHPYFLWSTQQIQRGFLRNNLGEEFWNKKRTQYKFVREDMDIMLKDN